VRRITAGLLILYILMTIVAVILGVSGFHISSWLTPLNTLAGFAFSILHAGQRNGWKATLILLGCMFFISLGMESIGVATGLVYGPYYYTNQLGVKFLGLVPLLIPIAWFMMMYPSMVIAERLIMPDGRAGILRRLGMAVIAGMVMTAWDVGMDPMMVAAGHWVWEVDGAFFGIPIHNFIGWWLTTFVSVAVYQFVTIRIRRPVEGVPECWAIISYTNQAAATVFTNAYIGLGGAGMAGLFAMLPWIIIGWLGGCKKGG